MTRLRSICLLCLCFSCLHIWADSPPDRDSLLTIWQSESIEDTVRMTAMNNLINSYFSGQHPDSVIMFGQQMLEMAKIGGYPLYQAQAQQQIGTAYASMGRWEESRSAHEEAVRILEAHNLKGPLAISYNVLGAVLKFQGDLDQAEQYLQLSIDLVYEAGDSASAINPWINMAAIFEARGDVRTSLEYNQFAMDLLQRYPNPIHQANVHNNLANNYKALGDISNAAAQYLQSRSIFEEIGRDLDIASTLNNLALLHIDNKDWEKAQGYLDEALDISQRKGLVYEEAMTHSNMATLYQSQQKFEQALPAFQQSLRIIDEQGIAFMKPYTQLQIGETLIKLRRLEEAEAILTEGLANAKVHGRAEDVADGYFYLGQLGISQGKWSQAKSYTLQGFDLIKDKGQPHSLSRFSKLLSKIYKQEGSHAEALQFFELHIRYRDSVYNEESSRALLSQEYAYTYEKQALQDSLENAVAFEQQEANLQRRTMTNWFLGAFLLLALAFGWMLFTRFRVIRQQKTIIESEKSKLDQAIDQLNTSNGELNLANAKLQELDASKSRFFTNISHEFRTPLTVISGMADQLSDPNPAKALIQRNTQHLLRLINQILDLRKLESGNLSLSLIQADVITFLKYGTESFESLAESKTITLAFHSNLDRQMMDYDPDKLLMVHSNLLSNAIKFTPAGGEVKVNVEISADKRLHILVEDSGKGIASEKLPMIFDRFYQVDDSTTREGEGTGIGLALTKELVQLMGGKIQAESERGKGSRFRVQLPISNEAPSQSSLPQASSLLAKATAPVSLEQLASTAPVQGERPSLLIIEDNPDIVSYLFTLLEDQYELFSAADGQAGIEAALEQVPDLIISDVMMPHKNGYEVCETLKLDERTSHIPIVMLTAKADQPSRLEGYKRGADAYLAKPFDKEELFIRLEKLLQIRQTLQRRYQSGQIPPKSEDPVIQQEDAFLTKARQFILDHMDESEYRGESLGKDLGMSRTNLHRKFKALTGQSTSHFIRAVRIDHARELLLKSELQVAEVAYLAGFSRPSYFHRVFQELNGSSPQEWREEHMEKPS